MLDHIHQWHLEFFLWLHSLTGSSPWFDATVTFLGNGIDVYIIGLAMLFILFYHHQESHVERDQHAQDKAFQELLIISFAVFSAWLINYIMKLLIFTPRPFEFFTHITLLFTYAGGDSFPSGHATVFAALGVIIFLLHRKFGLFFILAGIVIPLSRVIAGVHFPADIVGGWIIGGGVAYVVYTFFYRHQEPKIISR